MIEIECLECGHQIKAFYAKPGEVFRCVMCGARHVLPSEDRSDDSWIAQSREVQIVDDSLYQRWMPWCYRAWAFVMLHIYALGRLESKGMIGWSAEPGPYTWLETALAVSMMSLGLLTMVTVWAVLVKTYGWDMPYRGVIRVTRVRWIVEMFGLMVIFIAASEAVIFLLR